MIDQRLPALIEAALLKKPRATLPKVLDGLYQSESDDARRRIARHGIWLSFIMYLLFSVTDAVLIPDVAPYSITARVLVGLIILPVFEVQYHRHQSSSALDLTCAVALVVAYLAWLFTSLQTQYVENFSYYMFYGCIFMMGANLFFSFKFSLSVMSSTAILISVLTALYLLPGSTTYRVTLATFYLSCFAFTTYVNWKLNKERFSVFLNSMKARFQQTEAVQRGEALLKLSRTDALTGVANRRAVDEKLRDFWDDWQMLGMSFSAILVDVDFFKKFNDFYGHQEGDHCLRLVADALSDVINKHHGFMGRYGGEEFIILAPTNTQEEVTSLAEEIRLAVERLGVKHELRRDGITDVTVSVGAALVRPRSDNKVERIIHEADRALYNAKASGRNCTRVFDPNDPANSDETENIAALLRVATRDRLVSLVYQPIQHTASGETEAVEALMRLRMLDGTLILPSQFIPVAERTGAILDLGLWAIRTVCQDLLVDGHVSLVSVNVSPIQLKAPGFAASVAAILDEHGVSGSKLAFEITEGLDMEMHSDVLRCIADLKRLGVRIWLDDFGTGFAGLSWLRLIDFDTVKIDRSFLHDSHTSRGKAMLRDIVGLVRNRGHSVLIEGVETDEHVAVVQELAIDKVQGFHVGRPVSAKQFQGRFPIDPHLHRYLRPA
ncbi:EAL domain-containing protein [Tianweitania sp. BSSL-BM11]|uniref:EAL domain-containing protein n=1 Tax=Tianweitania aestuarii TaxID=2814886 RepID=A0ABS5RYB4_9HYPH|nr:EAL domain-containing protein [Tianweitania aestuarii]MBS9722040.1 EAL domain-containing protein [Tianweitania aestuarii]